jgi:hypothetical protein
MKDEESVVLERRAIPLIKLFLADLVILKFLKKKPQQPYGIS